MSELRDIRLLVTRNLDVSRNVKIALMDVMNIFDSVLDAEGWQAPRELTEAMRRLDRAIILDDDPKETIGDDEIDEEENEFIDIDDIEEMADDDDDEDEEDEIEFVDTDDEEDDD